MPLRPSARRGESSAPPPRRPRSVGRARRLHGPSWLPGPWPCDLDPPAKDQPRSQVHLKAVENFSNWIEDGGLFRAGEQKPHGAQAPPPPPKGNRNTPPGHRPPDGL